MAMILIDTTSPIEAGLGWITKFSEAKGDFLDREMLIKQKNEGVFRKLAGFELIDRGIHVTVTKFVMLQARLLVL